jgi:hypothetical protein
MYHISVQEFKEHVRLSHSWSELARRCGEPLKNGRFGTPSCVKTLRQKVLFLKLDTHHFKSFFEHSNEQRMNVVRAKRAWIAEIREGGAAGEGGRGGKGNMYQISPQEFSELVGLSHSWQELARRCGGWAMKNGEICSSIVTVLKQKVVFLELDTQHFMGMCQGNQNASARRVWIATVLKQSVCVRWTGDVGVLMDC